MTTTSLSSQPSNIWWLFLLQGIAGIILGLMLITAPGTTLIAMVTFLGFYWLITGVLSLVQMFVDRSIPWIWSLLSGILGIAAGILVLRHPLLAAVTVPTIIVIVLGVEALIMGFVNLIAGFKGGGVRVLPVWSCQHPHRTAAAELAGDDCPCCPVRLWIDPARAGCFVDLLGISCSRLSSSHKVAKRA